MFLTKTAETTFENWINKRSYSCMSKRMEASWTAGPKHSKPSFPLSSTDGENGLFLKGSNATSSIMGYQKRTSSSFLASHFHITTTSSSSLLYPHHSSSAPWM